VLEREREREKVEFARERERISFRENEILRSRKRSRDHVKRLEESWSVGGVQRTNDTWSLRANARALPWLSQLSPLLYLYLYTCFSIHRYLIAI
jgi:hypothetical protein